MFRNRSKTILKLLSSERLEDLDKGLGKVEQAPELLKGEDGQVLLSGVFMLFLLDTLDYPYVEPLIERAERLVASLGTQVVPQVLAHIEDSDIKRHEHLARTLVRIGMPAVPQIIAFHDGRPDPMGRVFALYALSKIRDSGVRLAIPLALRDMSSNHQELRDTATRSLGKMIEVIPATDVPADLKQAMFEAVVERLADPVRGVRAKGMRTLSKLASFGYLNEDRLSAARRLMGQALGREGTGQPDPAFIVRREAEIALTHLG